MKVANDWKDYEILDMANGEKLERWGNIFLVRPDPQIIWVEKSFKEKWKNVHGIYNRSKTGGGSWNFKKKVPESWQIKYKNLTFNIKPMGFKHTGLFPEQAVNWDWMINKIKNSKREIKVLNLFIKGKLVKIYSEFSEIEYRFNANGELYIADVYIMFNKSEPMEYFYKWKGRLCFEIKHTHAVDIFKIKNCYYEGIPIFEHTISSKMTFENVTSSNELKDRKNYVTKMLSEKIYGNIISDPSSNEYINYCRCINENYTLKSEINYLINKNNDLLNYQNENKHQMQMLKDVISKTEIQNEKLSDFKTKVMSSKTIKLILKLYNIEY